MVDARAYQEFGRNRIPGAIPIDPEHVLGDGRIKDPAIYSEDGLNASIVWFALQLMGYDSRLYMWNVLMSTIMNNTDER